MMATPDYEALAAKAGVDPERLVMTFNVIDLERREQEKGGDDWQHWTALYKAVLALQNGSDRSRLILRDMLGGTDNHVAHFERAAALAAMSSLGLAGRSISGWPGTEILDLDARAWRAIVPQTGRHRKSPLIERALWMLVNEWVRATGRQEPYFSKDQLREPDALDWAAECLTALGLITSEQESDLELDKVWRRMCDGNSTPHPRPGKGQKRKLHPSSRSP